MKFLKHLCWLFGFGIGIAAHGQVYSSNIVGYINQPLYVGDNLIANQLSQGDDTLNTIFAPGVPQGTTFTEWNPVTEQYLPVSVYDSTTDWSIKYTLSYGEGGLLNAPATFTNTFVGSVWPGFNDNGPFVPPLVTDSGKLLLSCYIPISDATFYDVVGRDPRNGESVTLLNVSSQIYTTTTFENGVWDNGTPLLNVGEAAFFDLVPVPEPALGVLAVMGFLLTVSIRRIICH